jgi:endo-beta-N-acetylglucosaminidase D
VKSLGTIILEPQAKNTGRLLQHIGEGPSARFGLATKLASIAKHYGFDGWLVNIEKPFAKEDWHANTLEAFLRQLREELGFGMQLVW